MIELIELLSKANDDKEAKLKITNDCKVKGKAKNAEIEQLSKRLSLGMPN